MIKMAEGFANCDVETILVNDPGHSRKRNSMYCQLIDSLASPGPEHEKGHFWSLSDVYRCKHCGKLIPGRISDRITCIDRRFVLGLRGDVTNLHEVDRDWRLTAHICDLREAFDDWAVTYWYLWAECHYVYCTACQTYYPLIESNNCLFHNNDPVFNFLEEEGISTKMHPIGRFTCCNSRTFRYHSVACFNKTNACKTRKHIPDLSKSMNSLETLQIYEKAKLYLDDVFLRKFVTDDFKSGCVTNDVGLVDIGDSGEGNLKQIDHPLRPDQRVTNRGDNLMLTKFMSGQKNLFKVMKPGLGDMSYDGCCLPMQELNTEERYFNRPIQYSKRTTKHKKTKCGLQSDQWVNQFSTRFNQDRQREWEKGFFILLGTTLTKRVDGVTPVTDKLITESMLEHSEVDIEGKGCPPNNEFSDSSSMDDSEDSASVDSFSSYCSTARVRHSRTTSVWNSFTPLAGSYVRIETELRDVAKSQTVAVSQNNDSKTNSLLSRLKVTGKARKPPTFVVQHCRYNRRFLNKFSTIRNEFSSTKTKVLEIPLLKAGDIEECPNGIWSFNHKSQELNYLSATYLPLPVTLKAKYHKPIKHDLTNDWSDLVDLEKAWTAFLCLFFENESLPPTNKPHETSDQIPEIHEDLLDE